ncbi:MAG TPA: hypothetical protein VJ729_02230 [Nitrososphaeraceae archaeon]|nr:hypothetical protein [Nitrososphaeraceae archaeon]
MRNKKNNETRLLLFGFLAAVVASMTFIAGGSNSIKTALAQGTNETSSGGMNMTGTEGGGGGSTTNKTATVTRDTVTILLEGKSIPGMGFLHLYDSTPYKIGNGHIALHIPCDSSSKPIVNVLVGQAPDVKPMETEFIKELSKPGDMCVYHVDIGSDTGGGNVTQTDIAIQNPSNQTITFPASSGVTIGVNEIIPLEEGHTH